MGAVVFSSQTSILHSSSSLPALSKTKFASFGRPNFLLKVKEITDGPVLFDSSRHLRCPAVSSKQVDGDRTGVSPRNSGQGRIPQRNEHNTENKSSKNPEEIISLFRRIQTSISRGSVNSKKKSSKLSEDGPSAESVLKVRQSRTKVKGKTARKDGDKILPHQGGSLRKEQKENYSSFVEKKSTRPPSNFVRRSPIPPSNQVAPADLRSQELPAIDDGKEMKFPVSKELAWQKVEGMKLPELKELAKSKGIKGYSKLRKAELVKLLITL